MENPIKKKLFPVWLLWLILVAVTVAAYWPTLLLTKHIWQDEVQILELGKAVFPNTDHSYGMMWRTQEARPACIVSYLGPALQESACQLSGGTPVGPRLSSIFGAIVASGALLGWLLSRRTAKFVALACSALLLWDPLFVEGYRGARVDSWTMTCMFLALWIITHFAKKQQAFVRPHLWEFFAGFVIAVAGLIWVSAIILLPLVIYQCLVNEDTTKQAGIQSKLFPLFWIGIFTLCMIVFLLSPIVSNLAAGVTDFQADASKRSFHGIDLQGLLLPFVRSPWIVICGIFGIFYTRSWGLALAFLSAVVIVLATTPYTHRNVYLVPYFLVAIATCATSVLQNGKVFSIDLKRRLVLVSLVALLLWSGLISLGARTVVALREREARNPDVLLKLLSEKISPLPVKAYFVPYEFYYAARQLGWKSYKNASPEDWSDPKLMELLEKMDIVIDRADHPSLELEKIMEKKGFARRVILAGPTPAKRLENYGEYIVYQRQARESTTRNE